MADDGCNSNGKKAAKALMMSGYLIPCLVSAVLVWYITTRETPRRLDKAEVKIEAVEKGMSRHDVSIKVLESEFEHVRQGIDRIEIALSKIDRGHTHAVTGRRRRQGP